MNLGKPHVLVVDDEPLNRDLLRRILAADYQVSEAEDAEQALAILADGSQDTVLLVLCDHLMPGKTGVELAEIASSRWPELAFLLITGCDEDEDVVGAVAKGIVRAVLPKPWRSKNLRALITENLP